MSELMAVLHNVWQFHTKLITWWVPYDGERHCHWARHVTFHDKVELCI